jgi:phosphonate C-P lyase system protein PhnH
MSTVPMRETRFDPVTAGLPIFRRLLDAAARPGAVVELDEAPLVVEPPGLAFACLLLLTALDRDVSVHVAGPGAESVTEYLRFNTGARSAPAETADFVLITGRTSGGQISRVNGGRGGEAGTGATVVYAPRTVSPAPIGGGVKLAVAAPNVSGVRRLHVVGIDQDELVRLQALGWGPLGVDVWLAAGDGSLAVIPRSSLWMWEPAQRR